MNKFLICAALAGSVLLSACTSNTELGPCIGAFDDENPAFVYKTNTANIIIGVVFFESVVVPAVVVFTELKCPIANRTVPATK